MRTSRRGLAWILAWAAFLVADLAVCSSVSGQGGGKPKPPPDIPRPICFWAQTQKPNQRALRRSDVNGTSIITVNSGAAFGSWPRWSPDGLMIGGYHKSVGGDYALMVMSPDGANEQVVMTAGQFNAWNLSRPGVLDSRYQNGGVGSHPCWLGNNAFVFAGQTTYDASFFGGIPGETMTAKRLFIVDANGTIAPLTEAAALGVTGNDSSPHWSPALNKIVFKGNGWLFAINPDGTGLVPIFGSATGWIPQHAVWNPAGDRLAVCAFAGREYHLYILDVDLTQPNPGTGEGGRVTAVLPFKTPPDVQIMNPSWSPDGRYIVYAHHQLTPAAAYPVGDYILIADVETGAETIVSGPASNTGGPDWDPLDLP